MKLNGTHQLLVYADGNILGGSVHTIKKKKKKTEALVVASKETGLEVNADKTKYVHGRVSRSECRTKYMAMSRDQNIKF